MLTLREVLDDAAALEEFAGMLSVDVNTRGITGKTPLHWMATLGDLSGTELLLNAGATIDAQDRDGNTPLHEAVCSRQHMVVWLLVQRGANAGVKNALGETALHLAQRENYQPTVEALRDAV
jgi:ankyrin repeat protein